MTGRTDPVHMVRYELRPGAGGLTLREISEFADRLRQIGADRSLDQNLHTDNRYGSMYVEGPLLERSQTAADGPDPDVMTIELESLASWAKYWRENQDDMSLDTVLDCLEKTLEAVFPRSTE